MPLIVDCANFSAIRHVIAQVGIDHQPTVEHIREFFALVKQDPVFSVEIEANLTISVDVTQFMKIGPERANIYLNTIEGMLDWHYVPALLQAVFGYEWDGFKAFPEVVKDMIVNDVMSRKFDEIEILYEDVET